MPATLWGAPTHVHIETDAKEGFMRVGGTVGSSNFAAAYLSISLHLRPACYSRTLDGRINGWQ